MAVSADSREPLAPGADYVIDIEVVREPDGVHRVDATAAFAGEPVTVHVGPQAEAIDFATPLAREVRHPVRVPGLPLSATFAFSVPGLAEPAIVGTRHYALPGAINLRDLGGYLTNDGRRVRWGRLFRSGHLSTLSASARDDLAQLGIATVCDFRLPDEREAENAVLPGAPRVETLAVPPGLADRHFFHRLFEETDDPERVAAEVAQLLRIFVTDFASRFRRLFDVLLAAGPEPVLLNCSAGKERTGVGSVLLLLALGVPIATARHDFLLSRRYFPIAAERERVRRKYMVPGKDPAVLDALILPLLETREAYADAVFDAIAAIDPVPDSFLQRHYGLGAAELATLRDRYTA